VSRRCLFLDRDGVINVKQPDGQYVTDWSQFEFVPAVFDWIQLFKAASFLIIVVTNQRCVAKKLISPAQLEGIHRRMLTELRHRGAEIDDVFVCPHDIDQCDCRKPLPGMINAAMNKWNIELAESILIGDSDSDAELARRCGLTFVRAIDGQVIGSVPAVDEANCHVR